MIYLLQKKFYVTVYNCRFKFLRNTTCLIIPVIGFYWAEEGDEKVDPGPRLYDFTGPKREMKKWTRVLGCMILCSTPLPSSVI